MTLRDRIETVRLELIRPGPTHGQLLSPLTPYLALCGEESPVTLQIKFEHWRLLNRLERLRYVTPDNLGGTVAQPDSSRESELEELGRDVGEIFAAIPTLGSELGHASGRGSSLVHLRLLISGSELALLPFELLISPTGYPGYGRPLLLQPETPIVITREIRRGQHKTPINWDRAPRILFVSAAPNGMHVPVREHIHALRRVIEPWVEWANDPRERLKNVKVHLNVLVNATLRDIRNACAKETYTHVHILAHGGSYKEAGQTRYGLVLCDEDQSKNAHIVDGKSLAEALHVQMTQSSSRSSPTIVSLATCDAGNIGSVIAPGGSIAHDLHGHGVPWVFASQFPLTKRGSEVLTEKLYHGLLWAEDPRELLAQLRLALHVERRHDHDWASLVAYAMTTEDLHKDIAMFRSHQYQAAIDNDCVLAKYCQKAMDASMCVDDRGLHLVQFEEAIERARNRIQRWKDQLPDGNNENTRRAREEYFGVAGSTEKKIAELYHKVDMQGWEKQALHASLAAYFEAVRLKPDGHWPATQYLALSAILEREPNMDLWVSIRHIAAGKLETQQGVDKAWALGTLAELELLRRYHAPKSKSDKSIEGAVLDYCRQLVNTVGIEHCAVMSTRRQFQRYVDWWQKNVWHETAKAAVAALTSPSSCGK